MGLSSELISQFAKITKNDNNAEKESIVYGTAVISDGVTYVKMDGSDLLTPVTTTADVKDGERVTVMIKDHNATITGNTSSPAARTEDVEEIATKISEFDILIADKVSTKEFDAEKGRIDLLISETIQAEQIRTDELLADKVDVDTFNADKAEIEELITTKLDADIADITYASIADLEAINLDVNDLKSTYGDFVDLTTDKFTALDASIKKLDTDKLSATEAELKYANIDFSNIGEAAMEYLYSKSGLIENITISNGAITGNLIGVTITGDLIEGNTIVADKLVIKGEDGLYYKLNTDGVTTETEQTEYNSINGSIITAKSITATKISVDDLVAFDATIGGFNITSDSIYSGVKNSIDNTTRGIFLGNDGQIAFGDASNYIKYYKDQNGDYKLAISAKTISLGGSNKTVETAIEDIQTKVETLKDEITTLLRIESSRGTVFKNDTVSTVLSVVIYHGSERITDSETMKSIFGNSAYLQWKWQRLDDDTFGIISSGDSRFGDNGFTFTISPEDVDTKVTFMCELII